MDKGAAHPGLGMLRRGFRAVGVPRLWIHVGSGAASPEMGGSRHVSAAGWEEGQADLMESGPDVGQQMPVSAPGNRWAPEKARWGQGGGIL